MLDNAAGLLSTVGDGALAAYLGILGVRYFLSRRYAVTHREECLDEGPVTVLQPILSGDSLLEETLRGNLRQAPPWARFLWLIDEDDEEAQRLTARLRDESSGRADILVCPPAVSGSNPKTVKLQYGLEEVATPYLAVLDDDTLLSDNSLGKAVVGLRSCDLYTGLPCYLPGSSFWSALVAYFVNNNSILTYLPLLPLVGPLSINGMFYVMRTQTVRDIGGFTPILDQLCDDYALARHVRAHGGVIRQSTAPHRLRTTVTGPGAYFRLMHRWFVFARVLVCDQPAQVVLLLLVFLVLPPLLLWIGLLSLFGGLASGLLLAATLIVRHLRPEESPSDGPRRTLSLFSRDVDPGGTASAPAWSACLSTIRTELAHAAHPAGARRYVLLPPRAELMMVFRSPRSHPVTPIKVVLLSGLSDPATCALSPTQAQFLGALEVPETCKVYWNFPYIPCPDRPRREPPLWLASLRNARQFLLASRRAYRGAARCHWQALTASAEEVVVITLSCGLEILNNCLDTGPVPRIRSFALGPVAWQRPRVPCTLVQGDCDFVSRSFFKDGDVIVPGVGHMGYLRDHRVLSLINDCL